MQIILRSIGLVQCEYLRKILNCMFLSVAFKWTCDTNPRTVVLIMEHQDKGTIRQQMLSYNDTCNLKRNNSIKKSK